VAVTFEVVTFCLFGIGLLLVAWGLFGQRSWSKLPFVVAQLLGFTVGIPLLSSTETLGLTIGVSITLGAAIGLISLIVGVIRSPDEMDLRHDATAEEQQEPLATRPRRNPRVSESGG
jgi:hypothetical protein